MKKAIIVGHTGQDGTYLSKLLKENNYLLAGFSTHSFSSDFSEIDSNIDIMNYNQVSLVVKSIFPDEIYYLAAIHHSSSDSTIADGYLFHQSFDINVRAYINFLEAVKQHSKKTKIFYAASSHIFGNPATFPQDENTPLNPNCVYGITKTAGIYASRFYRQNHNLHCSVGIFYNHESPLRQSKYVSKKIVETAVAIKKNKLSELILGNLDAQIDWGYAPDYMDAVHRVMKLDYADEFIISSGSLHSIRDFVAEVFNYLQLDWKKYVKINPDLITKKQKANLWGSYRKLQSATGWVPKTDFSSMIKILVETELKKYA